mgnify:CR=1 FL=1
MATKTHRRKYATCLNCGKEFKKKRKELEKIEKELKVFATKKELAQLLSYKEKVKDKAKNDAQLLLENVFNYLFDRIAKNEERTKNLARSYDLSRLLLDQTIQLNTLANRVNRSDFQKAFEIYNQIYTQIGLINQIIDYMENVSLPADKLRLLIPIEENPFKGW